MCNFKQHLTIHFGQPDNQMLHFYAPRTALKLVAVASSRRCQKEAANKGSRMARGHTKKRSDGATPAKASKAKSNGNAANLGFEAQLFLAADKLRKNLEPSDYKHV